VAYWKDKNDEGEEGEEGSGEKEAGEEEEEVASDRRCILCVWPG
jgi:hypothetical protein